MKNNAVHGFTLVELAIALMVIGLLIGGVLKGQELVENARVTQMTRQFTGFDTAVTIFRNTYGAWPGEVQNPSTRIPNCTSAPCNISGTKNGKIGDDSMSSNANEIKNFWIHMAKANLLSGVDSSTDGTDMNLVCPQPTVGGYFRVWYSGPSSWDGSGYTGNILLPLEDCNDLSSFSPTTTRQSAQIDRKMDDGKPGTGDIRAYDSGPTAGCISGSNNATYIYNEDKTSITCNLARKINS